MNHTGGMKFLAQGTHGIIYEMGDKVVKQFKNRPHRKPSLLPVDPLLKSYFLLGYKKYMIPELIQEITTMIDEYSI